ncbi:hypothetical protein [Streptomyces sp. NPDC051561]|uniref:hypothetical protein n=1 Tax=Streptomyces sp. NPDC051561 TaxID=3365658 RepID=UPI00378D269E
MAQQDERDGGAKTGPGTGGGGSGPGVHFGSVDRSAFAIGDHNEVSYESHEGQAPVDETQRRLLAEVAELRADLLRLRRTERLEVLDAELVEVEGEIAAVGEAGATRLERLRAALTGAEGVTAMLASGAAVAETVRGLLGG